MASSYVCTGTLVAFASCNLPLACFFAIVPKRLYGFVDLILVVDKMNSHNSYLKLFVVVVEDGGLLFVGQIVECGNSFSANIIIIM